jgi:metal-sulfur cluster biosynthetic enzyme
MVGKEAIIDALKKVLDPEIQLDVWTIGLIYGIDIKNDIVNITMTLTTIFCPYGPALIYDLKQKVNEVEGVKDCNVEVTFTPQWEPSEDLKALLGL